MPLCFGSDDKEPADEYDELPFGLRWRMYFGKKEIESHSGQPVLRLGNNRIVKTHCECTEYQALKLVDRHTSVPTYKVIAVYNRPEGKLVEYEAIAGKPLESIWPQMQSHQRAKVIADLGRFVEQLRKMDPPKHCVVGDATLGAALDHRFGAGKIGPFYTIKDFHDFERRGRRVDDFTEKEIQYTHSSDRGYKLKFSHAALCPRNILLDESGRISAIIGWESSGWYPEYWEYTQMCHATPKTMSDWLDAMCQSIPRYDKELVAEEALRARYTASMYNIPISMRAPSPSPSELRNEQQEIDDKNTENTSG